MRMPKLSLKCVREVVYFVCMKTKWPRKILLVTLELLCGLTLETVIVKGASEVYIKFWRPS